MNVEFADAALSLLACSADGGALIDLSKTRMERVAQFDQPSQICSVEIKTSVAASSLSRAIGNASMELICCKVGNETFVRRIPKTYMEQLIQQMFDLNVNYVLYVCCSESGILSCTLIYGTTSITADFSKLFRKQSWSISRLGA